MESTRDLPVVVTAESLSRLVKLHVFEGGHELSADVSGRFFNCMASAQGASFNERMAGVFSLRPSLGLKLCKLVTIYSLPFSHDFGGDSEMQKSLASSFGYMFVISGNGLFGAQAFFVKRNAIALAQAIEIFSKLKSLE